MVNRAISRDVLSSGIVASWIACVIQSGAPDDTRQQPEGRLNLSKGFLIGR
nr:hypothetical protein [uncultured Methanospirillum sp.]